MNEGFYEIKFAFQGLADEHVWRRPADGVVSIGENAGHIAHWEAIRLTGGDKMAETDLTRCKVTSPLIDSRFRYLPVSLRTPPTPRHLAMSAADVLSEVLRVHTESVAHFQSLDIDPAACPPGYPPNWTYRAIVRYLAFHVAYHTGQIYLVRHLLGESTPDN